jgi:general stress protein YciG
MNKKAKALLAEAMTEIARKGGRARAKALPPEIRTEIARKGGKARAEKARRSTTP